jgi:hypothetical protein
MGLFGWDYPPGVSGNEPQIVGYPDCANCGHEAGAHAPEDAENYDDGRCMEPGCDCAEYAEYGEDPREPDEPNDDPPSYAR